MALTDEQITRLRDEAIATDDGMLEAICREALGEDFSGLGCIDAWIDSEWGDRGGPEDPDCQADARAECARLERFSAAVK